MTLAKTLEIAFVPACHDVSTVRRFRHTTGFGEDFFGKQAETG
jgi:hypothetical protein